jgi:hypothetical protein
MRNTHDDPQNRREAIGRNVRVLPFLIEILESRMLPVPVMNLPGTSAGSSGSTSSNLAFAGPAASSGPLQIGGRG